MTKNNAASITFRRRLWHEWGVWPKSNTMPTYFSRFGRNWPGRGGPGCCGLAGPPKKNRLCIKRPGGRESRARISLLAYGKQADGGEGREAGRKTVRCCSMAAIIAPSYFQTPCSGGFFIFRVWKPRDPVAPIPTQCRPIPWANRGNAIDRVVFFSPYGPFMEKSAFVCRKSRNPCVETPPQWA